MVCLHPEWPLGSSHFPILNDRNDCLEYYVNKDSEAAAACCMTMPSPERRSFQNLRGGRDCSQPSQTQYLLCARLCDHSLLHIPLDFAHGHPPNTY